MLRDRRAQIAVAAVALYVLGYLVPDSPVADKVPVGVVAQGVIFGSSYALLGMGLILIYRTTRIVNFAYGAMGAMPGAITVGLFVGQGTSYPLAIAAGVLAGILTGALVEVLVIRRFARSSRLVLTVATIGLSQLLGAIGLGIGVLLGTDLLVGNIDTPLSGSFEIRPYQIRGDHLLMIGVVPVALALLSWFLLRTRSGAAVRAAAENRDRALLLGVPVARLQTIVWAIAGGLSTLTYVTRVPFTGVVPDALVGVTAILPGLATAVIAKFESLPRALVAGIGLGIAEWTIRWNVRAASVFDLVFLLVIVGGLLLRRQSSSRADTGESSWDSAGTLTTLPDAVRRAVPVRAARIALALAVGGVAVAVPAFTTDSTLIVCAFALVWAMVGVSLVVLTGWGGAVSLGQFAIVGIGAMVSGNLLVRWNVDAFAATVAAGAVGGLAALLIGLPALRIRGFYLAVTTLAFAVALDSYFLNPANFADLVPNRIVQPVLWKRFATSDPQVAYYLCLAFLVLAALAVSAVRRNRAGRVLLGTRDNERAAQAMSVHTRWVRIQTFVLAGVIAGVAGSLYAIVLSRVGQGTFSPNMSVDVFSFAVIGGIESIGGAILGVLLFRGLDFVLAQHLSGNTATIIRLSLSGTGLLVLLYFLPGGLWQALQSVRDRVADRLAAPGTLAPDDAAELDDDLEAGSALLVGGRS
jgi:branched-chain amino acid transport system permease protein